MTRIFTVTLPDTTPDGFCYSAHDVAAAIEFSHIWESVQVAEQDRPAGNTAAHG